MNVNNSSVPIPIMPSYWPAAVESQNSELKNGDLFEKGELFIPSFERCRNHNVRWWWILCWLLLLLAVALACWSFCCTCWCYWRLCHWYCSSTRHGLCELIAG